MASSSSIATEAVTTDTTSISGHVRIGGGIAGRALAKGFETLRGLALGDGSSSSSSSSSNSSRVGVSAAVGLGGHEYGNRIAKGKPVGNSLDTRAIHDGLHLQKRHLGGGAIAGITIGVVVAVALLAICLYPCFLYLKRRRSGQSHPAFDAEAGIAPHAGHGSSASGGANTPPKRLSSSDSYKHRGELTRGGDRDGGSADYGNWEASSDGGVNHGYSFPLSAAYLQPGDPGFVDSSIAQEHRVKAQPFPLLGCDDGEFAPPMADDHQPGVLKGTSADYYSPHIPSEAFGMVTQPDAALDSPVQPPSSRSSSLRQNMMQIFRRKTGRDATIDSTISRTTIIPEGAAASHRDGATPLQTLITTGDRVESPTNLSAASLPLSRSPSHHHHPEAEAAPGARLAPVSPPASNAPEPSSKATPPESPPFPAYHQFRKSPSPPVAAPGTVNPMDIMPASTETEVWHRTEHQLYEAFHKASTSDPAAVPAQETSAMPSPSPTPPDVRPQPIFTIQSPGATSHTGLTPDHVTNTDTNTNNDQAHPHPDNGDVAMLEATLPPNPDHSLAAPDGRHPSYPSDHSTPLPGPSFTDVSSQNTPSTQLDTPSPESMGSSDFRHSASPHSGAGGHSPRTGVYRCDEPGCNQAFDQPHKLKHHQRYHSKDHKCPYAGCGKGFGTKTHLQRHINDRHEKKKKFHCSVVGCDYSRAGGKAFPRKDNWKRHMIKIHNIEQQQLPEPIEVDMDLDGI